MTPPPPPPPEAIAAAPPQPAGEPAAAWPTALGAGMIVASCLTISGVLAIFLARAIYDTFMVEEWPLEGWTPNAFAILGIVLVFGTAVWLIVAGGLLIRHHPQARRQCIAAAIADILCKFAYFAASFSGHLVLNWSWSIVELFLGLLAWLALPVFLLCWFFRDNIRRQARRWVVAAWKRPRPAWPAAIGGIAVMFAGTLLADFLVNSVRYFRQLIFQFMEGGTVFLTGWQRLSLTEMSHGLGDILLLTAGILLLCRRPRAGLLTVIAAVVKILLVLVEAVVLLMYIADDPRAPVLVLVTLHRLLGQIPSLAIGVFLIYWMSKSSVRAELRSWKLARRQQAEWGERR